MSSRRCRRWATCGSPDIGNGVDDGYYWVPGTWVEPPSAGVLWTPGYWGWANGVYAFNGGYWGPHIGFYGGVNYGFGYGGVGFEGGEWRNGGFFYNRAVVNIGGSVHVTNVYKKTVIVNETNITRVSFNGGAGGVKATPTPEERAAMQEHHTPPTPEQEKHVTAAKAEPSLLASVNHGKPAVAATAKPAVFKGKGVVAAHGAAPASTKPKRPQSRLRIRQRPLTKTLRTRRPRSPQPQPAVKPAQAKPEEPKPEAKREESKPEAPAKPEAKPAAPKPAAKPAAPPRPAAPKPAPKPVPKPAEEKKE